VRGSAAEQRPLSPEQRRLVREAAAGLISAFGTVTAVLTSPLIAAIETAAIVAKSFDSRFTELALLDPSTRLEELLNWVGKQPDDAALVLVGHDPALSKLACRLLGGRGDFLSIKPAGACMLEVDRSAKEPASKLHWVMTPRQLRRHAR
jgi:phosphohistidine phosphatase